MCYAAHSGTSRHRCIPGKAKGMVRTIIANIETNVNMYPLHVSKTIREPEPDSKDCGGGGGSGEYINNETLLLAIQDNRAGK